MKPTPDEISAALKNIEQRAKGTTLKWVAVRPDGTICGPIGEDAEFVKTALIIGLKNVTGCPRHHTMQDGEFWDDIKAMGYSIQRAEIVLTGERWTP